MYPTRTTSTTGTFRIPPVATRPVRPALLAETPAAPAGPAAPMAPTAWTEASPAAPHTGPAPYAAPAPVPFAAQAPLPVPIPVPVPLPVPVPVAAQIAAPEPFPAPAQAPVPASVTVSASASEPAPVAFSVPAPVDAVPAARADGPPAGPQEPVAPYGRSEPVPVPAEAVPAARADAVLVAAPEPGPARQEAPAARRAEAVSALPHTRPTPAAEEPEPASAPPYEHPGAVLTGPRDGAGEQEARHAEAPVPAARVRTGPETEPLADLAPHPHPVADLAPHPEPYPYPHPAPEPPHDGGDPVAEAATDPEPEPEPEPAADPRPPHSGVPGPGVAEIVAQAVARGMEREEDDTQDLPLVAPAAPLRGAAVTEVPLHLPFRAGPAPVPPAAYPDRPARPRPAPAAASVRPAPGRRVPRGDDRLREHRGPVLPGWIGVAVGGLALAGCVAVLWRAGVVPASLVAAFGAAPRAYQGLRATHWPPLAFLGIVALLALGGLGRARTGHAWVLTLFGRYRGTVRRTGLTWVSPLLLRRRVDVRLRHWRSDPMPAVDSGGLALQVVVQVVWQVKDTARATLAVADHTEYLAEQVESAMARVLSQLPADAFHEAAPTLRDAEAVGDALTRMLAAETEAVGVEVFSAQPTRIEYAPEVAEAMRRRRVAAIDAKHRDTVLTSVVDAVDDTVHRLTSRGIVELDDYERKALVKDLTVAFYTGRSE